MHIRNHIDSHELMKHSAFEIAEAANKKIPMNGRFRVNERDVLEVFEKLLNLIE